MVTGPSPVSRQARPDARFWSGRRVLVTGHTGFKGAWLAFWLARLGADVTGVALPPEGGPSLFEAAGVARRVRSTFVDLRDQPAAAGEVRSAHPEVVFHLAAQALVREGYRRPVETFASNLMGTVHVLDALRGLDRTRVAVMVTTDKVYADRQWSYPYRETDRLGGHDPYAASKAACEIAIDSFRLSYLAGQGLAVASARAGNVIGGGDWARDRLIPDAVRAWSRGEALLVRRPAAVRPWQHVLEPLRAYIILAERLWEDPSLAQAFNIGPGPQDVATVDRVLARARHAFARGTVTYGRADGPHETDHLSLDISKAAGRLGIRPVWGLDEAIDRTMSWYRRALEGADAASLCEADIAGYEGAP